MDEILLEGWQFGGDTFLTVLGWKNGKWGEVYRARSNWCLDEHGAPLKRAAAPDAHPLSPRRCPSLLEILLRVRPGRP